MTDTRVVLGSGPDALRAAAARASTGAPVLLLQAGPTASGLPSEAIPVEPDRFALHPGAAALSRAVLGPVSPRPALRRGLFAQGACFPLPVPPARAAALLPPAARRAAASEWLRSRVRNGLAEVVGGGQEERSHRDWVVRRMGAPAWRSLYAPYAQARWGAPSEELSSVLARRTHALPADPVGVARDTGRAVASAAQVARIEGAGGAVRVGAEVSALAVEDGRVRAVVLADGERIETEHPLWVAAPPAQVARWLGADAPEGAAVEAGRLPAADAVRVFWPGARLPEAGGAALDELHVVSGGAAFWRYTAHSGADEGVVAHRTLAPGAPALPEAALIAQAVQEAADVGVIGATRAAAQVALLPGWSPVWVRSAHALLRTVLVAWQGLGIQTIGRSGTFAPLDPGAELAVCGMLLDDAPDLLEIQRQLVRAPARLDDLEARITRFVER